MVGIFIWVVDIVNCHCDSGGSPLTYKALTRGCVQVITTDGSAQNQLSELPPITCFSAWAERAQRLPDSAGPGVQRAQSKFNKKTNCIHKSHDLMPIKETHNRKIQLHYPFLLWETICQWDRSEIICKHSQIFCKLKTNRQHKPPPQGPMICLI